MRIERATPDHADAIGRITFEAFDGVARRHGFESEIVDHAMAAGFAQSLVTRPDVYGVVALDDAGDVVGHNFVQLTDAVAGVGPICVDPNRQSKGVGRALMRRVVDHARLHHGPQVRLFQEAFNMTSLSLYTSLGFDVTEPVVILSVPPTSDDRCRPLTESDVGAADALCALTQRVSRANELRGMIASGPAIGCVPHGRFEGDMLTAFVVPGFFGFAAARSAEDLIVTARVAVASLPPPLRKIILPTTNGELFRCAMKHGLRSLKVGQMMAMGPYERPSGFYAPSIAY